MKCDCGADMILDEWEGWIWTCFNCGKVGRPATNKEVKKYEREKEEWK